MTSLSFFLFLLLLKSTSHPQVGLRAPCLEDCPLGASSLWEGRRVGQGVECEDLENWWLGAGWGRAGGEGETQTHLWLRAGPPEAL